MSTAACGVELFAGCWLHCVTTRDCYSGSVVVTQGLALLCMCRPVSDVVKIETQSDWGYSLGTSDWKGATGHIGGKEVQPLSKS